MNDAMNDAALPDILIVDDDPGMVQVLAKALRPLGRLRFAMHGQDALERIASAVPDIVLLDAQMPGLSGFDVLDAIKANPALVDLPVIMVTSHAEADFEQAGLERGAADFIAKPIHPPVVQARVRTQLRLKQANDQLRQMSAADRQNLAVAMVELRESHASLQRTADELRQANDSLVQFVRIASHDLREPLNTIAQFVGLIDEDHSAQLPPEAQRYMRLVLRASARMRTLLDDVVRYARLQAGETDEPTLVPLDRVMAELRDALAARIAETGAELHIDPLPVVPGHASLLSLLFQNLLTNALKFVPRNRAPRVSVSACLSDGRVKVSVGDNGIGIAPEHAGRLFQPFQRLNLKSEYEGTGLGLAVARQVAEAHGGTIAVRPNAGQGAVFEVLLPLPPA
ncbi:response regulator [Hydrogenophaga sp. YM1]|uniref:sensor histidine kinase n=2 Tax=Hydrogenophaga TaxID=47420 RepID=UPI000878069A|nr:MULTISPECIES: ATP-binding protein [unclassified Hydrogenophaga]QRR35062.1 response regulator [Hydrogenophaga sp. YM1]